MGWVIFFIVLALLYWMIRLWYITLPITVIGLIIYWLRTPIRNEKIRQRKEQERKKRQEKFREEMTLIGTNTTVIYDSMSTLLNNANTYLDRAEYNFKDNAFAPFWDDIENSAKSLGGIDESIRKIQTNSSKYHTLVKAYDKTPPEFPVDDERLSDFDKAKVTTERMKTIVRVAQRDFHFASIYEQRKTNQILVAGFTNLAQALDRMSAQITASIDDLTGSVNQLQSTINQAVEGLEVDTVERAKREDEAIDLLKKIRHNNRV